MSKIFNVTANCNPEFHYMVDLTERLKQIRVMVDHGDYFTINRARQYGKTTVLTALEQYLKEDYCVISLDFQRMDTLDYSDSGRFAQALAREIFLSSRRKPEVPDSVLAKLKACAAGGMTGAGLPNLFILLNEWCEQSEKPIVLMIDETDTASNNQVFLDFLGQLRADYINRNKYQVTVFQSVILAGVYDIKNLKRKFVREGEHQTNSPWNIASDFLVDMSFSAMEIAGMLREYEKDYATGMDVEKIAGMIYDYTSGYPFLVSRICKLMDEQLAETVLFPDKASVWTDRGVKEAVRCLLSEKNSLFESLKDKIDAYPILRELLYQLLMNGRQIVYNPDAEAIDIAAIFGFVKSVNGIVEISNRIFETRLYNMFLSGPETLRNEIFNLGGRDKYQFIKPDGLDMKLILERFVVAFDDLYGDRSQKFVEEDGRRYFLLYLRPIINGTGNYYIESRTRNQERTDVIVDYCGVQYVIELKIWRGDSYNTRGEKQLKAYLDYYHLDTGYMLSFSFNKKKQIGVQEMNLEGKTLVEAVV